MVSVDTVGMGHGHRWIDGKVWRTLMFVCWTGRMMCPNNHKYVIKYAFLDQY